MSYANGPKIVTDGLVLCLDAGNSKSYPGSGSVWYDLSGNGNDGTLVNAVGYTSSNKGGLVFNGTNNVLISNNSSINPTSAISVAAFFNISSYNNYYAPILFKQNNYTSLYEQYSLFFTNTTLGFTITGIDRAQKTASVSFDYRNTMVYAVGTCDTDTDELKLYVNGSLMATSSFTSTFDISTKDLRIGTAVSSYQGWAIGNIYNIAIYNTALSESEVSQNYLATKGRFGLS